jgi:DDE superfamily endonuclease
MAVGLCYGVGGGGCSLFSTCDRAATTPPASSRSSPSCGCSLAGEKATLPWDGLPAHRSKAMAAFLATQRDWLVVERLPEYAPELNPAEQVWANLKGHELANLACERLGGVIRAAWQGIGRIGRAWHLPYSFLRHAGLSVS